MTGMTRIALIGFGEAGMAFAGAMGAPEGPRLRHQDRRSRYRPPAKRADYASAGIQGADTLAEALAGAELVISLVTADQALAAAPQRRQSCSGRARSIAISTASRRRPSRRPPRLIEAAGGLYADVAVMAPVHPARLAVPLLVSGADACAALAALGFSPRRVDGPVGRASTIKMLRSVMVKGIEALTAECFLAAREAGVADEVAASLDASWPGADWAAQGRLQSRPDARAWPAARRRDGRGRGDAATGMGQAQRRWRARPHLVQRRTRRRPPIHDIGGRMIIDCHGHYTTAPAAHNDWRDAQKAAFKAGEAPPPYPAISDDEIRETLEKNQLRLLRERGADMTIFSPRASAMAHHVGDEAVSARPGRGRITT